MFPIGVEEQARKDGVTAYACFYTHSANAGTELFAVSFFESKVAKGENLTEIATWSRWMDTYQKFPRPFWKKYIGDFSTKSGGYGELFDL